MVEEPTEWQHIHQLDLRLKIASSNLEEASQKSCPVFFTTILQADATTIIPPYLQYVSKPDGGFIYCQVILCNVSPTVNKSQILDSYYIPLGIKTSRALQIYSHP